MSDALRARSASIWVAGAWLHRAFQSPAVRVPVMALLMAAIFISDTLTDLEIATAVFYIAVILLAVGRVPSRYVVGLAAICLLLTLVSFVLTKSGSREAGVVNLSISLSTICITTYLALKMVAAEGAAHEARAQLIRVARVTSLGELAASIAHEVNQPLAAIASSGDTARRWLCAEPPGVGRARDAIDRVIADANRASTIIARVREHARSAPAQRGEIRIDTVIEEAVAWSQAELERQGITLDLAMADQLPVVLGDRIQLQQVLCNLILNAIEAMATVSSRRRSLAIAAMSDVSGDIVISVSDTGPGIREEHMPHLFDAFWTTKEGGTGIGLTIIRTIVEAHGGAIWVDRMKPYGARFHVRLPASGIDAE
ncbi:sensor histidine kinase [Sphingomonas morindae]|uniref:histidine kinase n=1 Tax=Sphingomonas morindae TaxID=1541170 RepID=A0ABY4XCP2_9SPHN|nr:ATP-binding protein [Sphingomonas morindae]USI74673.1 GHKL domain-containing protein [Sphingomonas morindae]